MKYAVIKAFDCPDAWYKVLNEIWYNGEIFNVGYGSEITETKKLNVSIEITNPANRPLLDFMAPCDLHYVQWYALKYLWSGEIDDETYTYGSRLRGDSIRQPIDQVEEGIERYVEEIQDRQVTFVIRLPEDIKKQLTKDRKHEPPCLSIMDTEISDNKLHLTCYFRSWDAYAGLPANIAGIQIFNEALVSEINRRANMNLETGKLIFHSKNCHIYERLYALVEEKVKPGEDRRRKMREPKRS